MSPPETKKELCRILGFFSYFREHIPNFASAAKLLTDLTTIRYHTSIPRDKSEQQAFSELKELLQTATEEPLCTVDFQKPFNLFVDDRSDTAASALTQTGLDGNELPIAFSSTKLSQTQTKWSTIEKEAYALLLPYANFV